MNNLMCKITQKSINSAIEYLASGAALEEIQFLNQWYKKQIEVIDINLRSENQNNAIIQSLEGHLKCLGEIEYRFSQLSSQEEYHQAWFAELYIMSIDGLILSCINAYRAKLIILDEALQGLIYKIDEVKSREKEEHQKSKKSKDNPEERMELELYLWLISNGIEAERQVSTSSMHRIDIWIPSKLFLELKAGNITGDDICQAMDYYAIYSVPILLVGKGLTKASSRGIDAFNKVAEDSIAFVSWNAVKPYLKGFFGLT